MDTQQEFPATSWGMVVKAGNLEDAQGRAALGQLVKRYEGALTRYLQRHFCLAHPSHAKELCDGFVASILVENEALRGVRPCLGHQFRSFLLHILHNYAVSELRRATAKKRCPSRGLESVEQLVEVEDPALGRAAPHTFDLEWARDLVLQAISQMENECRGTKRPDLWGVFEARIRQPILEGEPETDYATLVRQFGFASPAQAQNALVTAKRKFERILREMIAEYVPEKEAIECELRELLAILAHSREELT